MHCKVFFPASLCHHWASTYRDSPWGKINVKSELCNIFDPDLFQTLTHFGIGPLESCYRIIQYKPIIYDLLSIQLIAFSMAQICVRLLSFKKSSSSVCPGSLRTASFCINQCCSGGSMMFHILLLLLLLSASLT